MNYKQLYLWIIFVILTNVSCNNWLDVQPKSQTSQEVLFSKPEGYKSSLAGIYSMLTTHSLYSFGLTMGHMDVIGQYYDVNSSTGSSYEEFQELDYSSGRLENYFSGIWSGIYNAIANANVLITELNKRGETVLSPDYFHIIKGEAHALRAFLHFELLKLFSERYVDGSTVGIPYIENFDMQLTRFLQHDEIFDKIIQDFDLAKLHLKLGNDPICTGNTGLAMDKEENIDYFLSNRRERLNYYATYALMARVYIWKGDYENAEICVDSVLNSKYFPKYPTNEWTFTYPDSEDRLVSNEIIFRLRDDKLIDVYKMYTKVVQENYTSFLALKETDEYFKDNSDYRKIHCIKTDNSKFYPYSIKYKNAESYSVGRMIPIIRRAELVYYKAEIVSKRNINDAVTILNTFQNSRGIVSTLGTNPSQEAILDEILLDAKREFIGEGQLFSFYKRLNRNLKFGKKEINMSKKWTFPVPQNELEFNAQKQ